MELKSQGTDISESKEIRKLEELPQSQEDFLISPRPPGIISHLAVETSPQSNAVTVISIMLASKLSPLDFFLSPRPLEPLEVRPHWQVSPLGQAFGVRSWPLVLAVFCIQAHRVVNE